MPVKLADDALLFLGRESGSNDGASPASFFGGDILNDLSVAFLGGALRVDACCRLDVFLVHGGQNGYLSAMDERTEGKGMAIYYVPRAYAESTAQGQWPVSSPGSKCNCPRFPHGNWQ